MDTPHSLYSRRALLRTGAQATLAATFAAGLMPGAAHAIDWRKLFADRMPSDAFGTVRELVGQGTANDAPLAVGGRVPSGALVRVEQGGRAAIALEDDSIFTVYGGSSLELLLNRMSQGVLNLLGGAVLAVVNTGGAFLVAGSTATFGIKGTVVYRQSFGPGHQTGRATDGLVQIPTGYSDYFCTCNGETEFMLSGRGTPYRTNKATYHTAYFLNPADPTRPLPAPMLNHQDAEIRHIVGMQENTKHDISWLKDQ
jgi:hypothetical protein